MPEPQCFVFGAFQLDLCGERLWCGHEVVRLPPKPFAVLACLVTQAGRLVTKDALLAAVWPDTVVSEDVITVAMRQLRRVLGDQTRTPHFIETVHGRGYRFIAPVSALASSAGAALLEAPRPAPPPLFCCPPHFVGREAALAQLAQWWTTARQGTRQVGMIVGEPGIGKTALVETFLAQVAATEDVWVGYGQCLDHYGAGEAYLPLLEALGRFCRGPEGERLVALLRQHAPSWLIQMPGLVPSTEWKRLQRMAGGDTQPRMLRELTEALDVLTTERPLVLVVEDLHWSDLSTLEWLTYVARRRDPARLLLLGTYRPVDAILRAHPIRTVMTELTQHQQAAELPLDYLSEADVTTYCAQRWRGDARWEAVAHMLHQRTRGHPLFLVTLIDEMRRLGLLHKAAAGGEVASSVEALRRAVPASLRHIIEQPPSSYNNELPISIRVNKRPEIVTSISLELDRDLTGRHLQTISNLLRGFAVATADSRKDVGATFSRQNLEIVYFYCHGKRELRPGGAAPIPYLEIGDKEQIKPADITTWYFAESTAAHHWETTPLVFINGCHTAELSPELLVNFVDVFSSAKAGGVIGTEISVDQPIASEAAERFLFHFGNQQPVGEALRRVRLGFLKKGNLMGLAYTAYCSSDLHISNT